MPLGPIGPSLERYSHLGGGSNGYAVWVARREITTAENSIVGGAVPERAEDLSRERVWKLLLGILAALVGLVASAQALLSAAVSVARALGVSERVVGLAVVSVGTSLARARSQRGGAPEAAGDAVANVVGSNIFNLPMIPGAAALARPLLGGGAPLLTAYAGYVAWLASSDPH